MTTNTTLLKSSLKKTSLSTTDEETEGKSNDVTDTMSRHDLKDNDNIRHNNNNNDDDDSNGCHDSTGSLNVEDLVLEEEEEPTTAMVTTKKKKTDENDNSYHVTFSEQVDHDSGKIDEKASNQEIEKNDNQNIYADHPFYKSDFCISYSTPLELNKSDNNNNLRNAPGLKRFNSWSNRQEEIKEEEVEAAESIPHEEYQNSVFVPNLNSSTVNHTPNRRRLESKSSDDHTNGGYSSSIDDNMQDYFMDDESPKHNHKIPTSPLYSESSFGSSDHLENYRNNTPTTPNGVFHSFPHIDYNTHQKVHDDLSQEEKQRKYVANASHHQNSYVKSFQKSTDRYTKEASLDRRNQFNDNPKNKGTGRSSNIIPERMNEYVKQNRIFRHHLPLSQVSSWIVRHAPCFWCCFCLADLPESSATDRMILIRLNYLCAIFSIVQVGVGIFLCVILFDPNVADRGDEDYYLETLTPNLWTLSGMLLLLALLGSIIFCTMLTTRKLIKEVNLQGSLRFLWVLYWILPLETFFVVALFDSHSVTEVWVRHWWSTAGMAWFREVFCAKDTAHSECVVPWNGGPKFQNESEWCIKNNGTVTTTDCGRIRDTAQSQMNATSYIFFTANAIWGVCLVLLLLLALAMLQGIISTPVVQKSKEANMPVWLTMPTIFSFTAGCILLFSPTSLLSDESGSRFYWIGISYMVTAGTFLVTAILGYFLSTKTVLNTHDNVIKQIAVNIFIVFIFFGIVAVAAIFVASIIYSLNIVSVPFEDEARGAIACVVAATTNECSNCPPLNTTLFGPDDAVCPEWAWEDVLRVIQTQLKSSAIMGGIFLIYALSALRFGFTLRSHINAYEIEYV